MNNRQAILRFLIPELINPIITLDGSTGGFQEFQHVIQVCLHHRRIDLVQFKGSDDPSSEGFGTCPNATSKISFFITCISIGGDST